MKEIKFRVVDNVTGEIFGYERFSPTNGWMHYLTWETQEEPIWRPGIIDAKMDKPFERQMFVGRKDANDKDIYEGDIILTPLGHETEIIWDECAEKSFEDVYEYTGFSCRYKGFNYHLDSSIIRGKIIGNNVENPELSPIKPCHKNKESTNHTTVPT